jgi:hypothetical protein
MVLADCNSVPTNIMPSQDSDPFMALLTNNLLQNNIPWATHFLSSFTSFVIFTIFSHLFCADQQKKKH